MHRGAYEIDRRNWEHMIQNPGRDAARFYARLILLHSNMSNCVNNMVVTAGRLGRCEDAVLLQSDILRRALNLSVTLATARVRCPPALDLDIAIALRNLACTYSSLNQHEESLEMLEKALVYFQKVLPRDDPLIMDALSTVACKCYDLGISTSQAHFFGKALEMQEYLLALRQQVQPPGHPDIAVSMSNLGMTYHEIGMHQDALKMQEGALDILQRARCDPAQIAQVMFNMGGSKHKLGDDASAIDLTLRALEVLEQGGYPPDYPATRKFQDGLEYLLSLEHR